MIIALLAGVSPAADLAHLKNGFSIRHERREVVGDVTRLYLGSGFVDVASADIVNFEHDDTPEATPAAPSAKTIDEHVADASKSSGIDPDFLKSVIHHESSFNPNAVSKKGARGLMQLMPQTADQLGVHNSFDPGQNIQGGTAYLRQLLEMYRGDAQKALAAYNAGPHRVNQYKGVPPYSETRAYVAGIIREYNRKKLAQQKPASKSAPSRKKVRTSNSQTAKAALISQLGY